MEEEKKGQGFVVRDKRHFDESGNVRPDEPGEAAESSTASDRKPEESRPETGTSKEERSEEDTYPAVDFIGFILSLSTTAMYHFGDIPDPYTQKKEKNLAAAKQTIEILNIIYEKTRGNLDEQEKQILEEALYELRMRYIKEQGKP
ncbi:MAG: DUF1844 domain-containing protein [Syntrophaceae bacterium]|nr:DUF1844 domain-containing protein [Syntrophaceae bacterium]